MKKLLEDILESLDFKKYILDETKEISVYTKRSTVDLVHSAFVILDITTFQTSYVLADLQFLILSLLETNSSSPQLEKNTTLILLLEHKDKQQDIHKKVSEIEEDQYYFKKQVLFYTAEEKKLLLKSIDFESLINSLETILYDQEKFINYSEGKDKGLYSIVSRTYSKLPFLTIQRAAHTRPDIRHAIDSQLNSKNLLNLRDLLLSIALDENKISDWFLDEEIL